MIGGSNNSPVDHFYPSITSYRDRENENGIDERKGKGRKKKRRDREKKETENERNVKAKIESIYRQDYTDKITNVYRCLTSSFTFNYQTTIQNDVYKQIGCHHATSYHCNFSSQFPTN
jgi:hypothetical protein